ncbi:MAG: anti-sigma factor [Bryobacter sp.]|nr:anti-sigma factor [Bryobacter sp.]
MNCTKMENGQSLELQNDLLVRYVANQLSGEERVGFEAHLAECSACQEELAAQFELHMALERWEAPAVSPQFDAKLWAQIRAEKAQAPAWRAWLTEVFGGWRGAAFAVPAFAMLLVLIFWPSQMPNSAPKSEAPIDAAELQEIERSLDDYEALMALQEPVKPEREEL